jgi:DNA-binding MurR/RpiR family transcriptional regulator
MPSVTLQKRLGKLEEAALEEYVDQRLVAEIEEMLRVLERNLSEAEFLKVAHILAQADAAV